MNKLQRQGDWTFHVAKRGSAQGSPVEQHAGGGLLSSASASDHSHVAVRGSARILTTAADGAAVQCAILPDEQGIVEIGHLDSCGKPCGHGALRFDGLSETELVIGKRQIQISPDGLVVPSVD